MKKTTQTLRQDDPARKSERREALERALDEIARHARNNPDEYLRDSRVPEGGE